MTIEVALVISAVSLGFGIYQGISSMKRNEKNETKEETSQLTTVIVKLENIGTGIARIESELNNLQRDFKEDHDELVKVIESVKSAHKRLDQVVRQLNQIAPNLTNLDDND